MSYKLLNNIDFYDTKEVDSKVNDAVEEEKVRAMAAESQLLSNIATVSTDLATEVTRAKEAEDTLTTNLNNEVTRAKAEELVLETRLNTLDIPEYEETTDSNIQLIVNKPLYYKGTDTNVSITLKDDNIAIGRTYRLLLKAPDGMGTVAFTMPTGYVCATEPELKAGYLYHMIFTVALSNVIICHTDIVDLTTNDLSTALLEPIKKDIEEIKAELEKDVGNNLYVTWNSTGLYANVSSDGKTWTQVKINAKVPSEVVIAHNDTSYVMITAESDGIYCYNSADGSVWTSLKINGTVAKGLSIGYSNGKFVFIAASNSAVYAYYSTNGTLWTNVKLFELTSGAKVASYLLATDTNYIALISDSGTEATRVYTSTNGMTWGLHNTIDYYAWEIKCIIDGTDFLVTLGGPKVDGIMLLRTSDFVNIYKSHVTYRNTIETYPMVLDGVYTIVGADQEGVHVYSNSDVETYAWTEEAISTSIMRGIDVIKSTTDNNFSVLGSTDNGVQLASKNSAGTWVTETVLTQVATMGVGASSVYHINVTDLIDQVAKNTIACNAIPALTSKVEELDAKVDELEEEIKKLKTHYDTEVTTSSDTWTVTHELGYNPGGIKCFDESGIELFGAISYPDTNTVKVVFSEPVTGHIYIS